MYSTLFTVLQSASCTALYLLYCTLLPVLQRLCNSLLSEPYCTLDSGILEYGGIQLFKFFPADRLPVFITAVLQVAVKSREQQQIYKQQF